MAIDHARLTPAARAALSRKGKSRTPQVRDASGANKTERRYHDEELWPRFMAGEITPPVLHPPALQLALGVTYTADWGFIEFGEEPRRVYVDCKGTDKRGRPRIEPVSRVKMMWAAQRYPDCVFLVAWRSKGGGWNTRRMGGG